MARVTRGSQAASQGAEATTKQTKKSETAPSKPSARGKIAAKKKDQKEESPVEATEVTESTPAKQQRKRKADESAASETKATAKKTKTSTATTTDKPTPAKRGRPKKAVEPNEEAPAAEPKAPGRGKKAALPATEPAEEPTEETKETPKKAGRPKKIAEVTPEPATEEPKASAKRGRPRKLPDAPAETVEAAEIPAAAPKRGRPKKAVEPTPEPIEEGPKAAPKRGRPPKKAAEPAAEPVEEEPLAPAKKGGRQKKVSQEATEKKASAPKKGRGKKADTAAPAAPSKVTKKAPAKAKAPAKSGAKKDAAQGTLDSFVSGKDKYATPPAADAVQADAVAAQAPAAETMDTDVQPAPEVAPGSDTEMETQAQPDEASAEKDTEMQDAQPEDKENELPEEPYVPRNRFVTPEEQKTPRSRRIVRDLVVTPSRERTIDQLPPIVPPEDTGESSSKAPPPPPKKAKPQRTDTPGSSRFTALNSGTTGTPKDSSTPKQSTPKSMKKTPVKRKSLMPNEVRNLNPAYIPGLQFKTLAVPQPDWDDKVKPNWAKSFDSRGRFALAQRGKKLPNIEHDAYITERGYNRLKKMYADIDKRIPEKADMVWMTTDRDGYAVIEVLENNLRDYYNELIKFNAADPHGSIDIIHLYSIAEAVILGIHASEDYHFTQVDDGDRVEALVNLIACMTLDLIWRLHIYKDLFTPNTPLKSLPLILGMAVAQFEDLSADFGFELDGGHGPDEDAPVEVNEAMEEYDDAIQLIKAAARKGKIPLYSIEEGGLEVLSNEPEEGDDEFDINWINVDFEQQVWDYLGKGPGVMAFFRTIEDAGFGGRRYMPGYREWVITRA
ncbi:hypothetical protein BJ508DRAFT_417910 [Ascobolus immersus RN42]|uniref:Uncharacterized protein n=1 Tax=Ascobolus immersus RN42 TaxID=1160509 RepID=A0A3N4I1Q1_ASCIM|nr:hypothetical protein BJ508DRAFT_417910 [Ascobolus immersus RN42]